MGCGMCGGGGRPPRTYTVTLVDGSTAQFLSEVEARVYATTNGGGSIAVSTPTST